MIELKKLYLATWVSAKAVEESLLLSTNVPFAIGIASGRMGSIADSCHVIEWSTPINGDGVLRVAGLIKPIVDELCNVISVAEDRR